MLLEVKTELGIFLSRPVVFPLYFLCISFSISFSIFFVFPSIFPLHFLFLTCSSISSAFDTNNSLFSDKVSPGNPGLERTLENGFNFTSNIVSKHFDERRLEFNWFFNNFSRNFWHQILKSLTTTKIDENCDGILYWSLTRANNHNYSHKAVFRGSCNF